MIGGDDLVPIPLFEAFAGRGSYTVLQIDAHIDWRDDVNGERLGLSSTMRRASEMGQIGRIIQVGQRGIGQPAQRTWRTPRRQVSTSSAPIRCIGRGSSRCCV